MSVTILYCEGGKKSLDIRVLTNLLERICIIKPAGSKYGLDRKILFVRQEKFLPGSFVAALKDRDFDDNDSLPANSPISWSVRENEQNIQIGWSWERKEIENYLIDPEVVLHALGSKVQPIIDDYSAELEESAKTIADYTAARIALSLCRQSYLPLKNCWGNICGQHLFPDKLSESDCRDEIRNIVSHYEQFQHIVESDVLNRFHSLLSVCRIGGNRFQNFMTFFSGKDLLYGMKTALINFGLGEPFVFRERIVKGIERSPDVWTWLPEWNQLRQLVRQTPF